MKGKDRDNRNPMEVAAVESRKRAAGALSELDEEACSSASAKWDEKSRRALDALRTFRRAINDARRDLGAAHASAEMREKARERLDELDAEHSLMLERCRTLRSKGSMRRRRGEQAEREMLFRLAAANDDPGDDKEERRAAGAKAAAAAGMSAIEQNRSITSSLKRCQKILAQEMDRIGDAGDMLSSDQQTIVDTKSKYGAHASKVGNSREHLTKLQRQERIDRIMIGSALVFFFCVVLHIISKRFRLGALVPFGSTFGL